MNYAITLNTLACAALVIGGIISCIFSYKENQGDRRFVFRATVIWTFGLAAWFALWIFYRTGVLQWGRESTFAMLLSDVNTAAGFLFYVIIIRGRRNRITDHIRDALPLLTLPGIATLSILAYDWWNPNQRVHTGLSLAYSMITPILVGWAIRLRFIVVLPLALSCLYAILQPPSYGALFSEHPNAVSQETILMILAITKIVWGNVVFYALAREVTDTSSIVIRISVSGAVSRKQTILFYVQLSLGILIAFGYLISLREESRNSLMATAQLAGIAAAIVGVVLGILTYHKKTSEASNNKSRSEEQ